MTRIGLIADTHGWLDETIFEHFKNCDEIWHAGDFGSIPGLTAGLTVPGLTVNASNDQTINASNDQTINASNDQTVNASNDQTRDGQIIRGVYGNIDGGDIRAKFPEQLVFMCEEVKVMMLHIGGYPPRYNPETRKELLIHKPQLFISGHSHILKVMFDDTINCLHMNPGAAGRTGWHKVRTIITFAIDGKNMKDCNVIELGKRTG